MRRLMYVACAMLVSCALYAQEVKLTVDSQTPGWLSSLLTYPQQQSVEELTLTGYINKTDMSFVNGLIRNQNLKVLDLSDVHLVGDSNGDDYIWDYFLSYGKEKVLQKVRLPQDIKGKSGSHWIISSLVDSLELGYEDLGLGSTGAGNTVSKFCVCPPQHLILLEGVKIIPDGAFAFKSTSDKNYDYTDGTNCLVTLPSTITRIGGRAFDSRCVFNEPLVLPDSIEYMGKHVFSDDGYHRTDGYGFYNTWWVNWTSGNLQGRGNKKPVSADRFDFPRNLISYNSHSYEPYMNASGEKESFPCDTYESDTIVIYDKCEALSVNLIAKIAVFQSKKPIVFADWDRYHFRIDTLYVPQGCLTEYIQKYRLYGYGNYIKNIKEMITMESLTIVDAPTSMFVGDTVLLKSSISPSNTFDKSLQWSCDNEDVATVDGNGQLIALSPGVVTISVTNRDRTLSDLATICVFDHTTGVELSKNTFELKIGEKYLLNAITLPQNTSDGNVVWSSTDEDIATVDENGKVKGVGRGQCCILATAIDGGHSAMCIVTVIQPVESLIMEKHSLTMNVGETKQIYTSVLPASADNKNLLWSSLDELVARVDREGNITALKAGETYIKVVSDDNSEQQDSCRVSVKQPVMGVSLDKESCRLNGIGESVQLQAEVSPEDASNKQVNWISTNENVCIVSNGTVVAVGYGTAVIIVNSVDGGYMATCTIIVENSTTVNSVQAEMRPYKILNIQGTELPYPQKGINIIRFNDGKTKKIRL